MNISCISKVFNDMTITTSYVQRHSAKADHPRAGIDSWQQLAQDDNCGRSWINAELESQVFSLRKKQVKKTQRSLQHSFQHHWKFLRLKLLFYKINDLKENVLEEKCKKYQIGFNSLITSLIWSFGHSTHKKWSVIR